MNENDKPTDEDVDYPMDAVSVAIRNLAAPDPCIMRGCVHEYGHEGEHEYQGAPW